MPRMVLPSAILLRCISKDNSKTEGQEMTRKEFYETLSDETKAKIKACSSEAEMMKVLEEEQIELASELLDGVSG